MTRVTFALLVSTLLPGALVPVAQAQLTDFEPVTTEELLSPDDGDWINWRRTLNGQGFRRSYGINYVCSVLYGLLAGVLPPPFPPM